MTFWDTSALLKLYVRERDSNRFRELMRNSADVSMISQLTLPEMHRALWGKVSARVIRPDRGEATYRRFRADVETAVLNVIPFGRDVQYEFDRIISISYRANPAVPIRTFDGLLLASALVGKAAGLVSTDSRMRAAAPLLGLRVLPERLG